jgi:hypothetical protein
MNASTNTAPRLGPAAHELVERLDDRLAQRLRLAPVDHRLADEQRIITMPGSMNSAVIQKTCDQGRQVGEDQRQRAGHQAGDAVGIDVHRVAQPQLDLGEEFAPVGVERDVLRRENKASSAASQRTGTDVGRSATSRRASRWSAAGRSA